MNKQDYIYYKNKKGIVIYHVPSKRRIILDEKYTERVIDYLDKNKEDMEFYEFLVNTFDEEKKNKDNIVNIELMTANTCNLSCKYCYANYDTKTVRQNYALHDPKSPNPVIQKLDSVYRRK